MHNGESVEPWQSFHKVDQHLSDKNITVSRDCLLGNLQRFVVVNDAVYTIRKTTRIESPLDPTWCCGIFCRREIKRSLTWSTHFTFCYLEYLKKYLRRILSHLLLFSLFFSIGIIDFARIYLSSYCYALFVYSESQNPSRSDTTRIHSTTFEKVIINVVVLSLINFLSRYYAMSNV